MPEENKAEKCWVIKNCTLEKRKGCPSFKQNKNCWEVMDKHPSVQCAKDLKVCVAQKCPVFMDNASDITRAWLHFIRFPSSRRT